MSAALITALVLALISSKDNITGNTLTLPINSNKFIDTVLSRYNIIRDQVTYTFESLQMSLLAYFNNKPGCLYIEDTNESKQEERKYKSKELLSSPCVIYMETVPGSSKIKENLGRVKALMEYRLFLSAIGVSSFEKNSRLDEISGFYGYKPNDLRELLH